MLNAKGMFFVGTRGSVIDMASQAGRRGETLVAHDCASKATVLSYTPSAALAIARMASA